MYDDNILFTVRVANIWNSLPEDVFVSFADFQSFKRSIINNVDFTQFITSMRNAVALLG